MSHSRALARAAVALAGEMRGGPSVAIEIAAGLDEDTFGTDAVAIQEAIERADGGRGVVVLMDLGSAVLSAELALELMDDEARERVLLCPAPLVEGLVVAAVSAASGADRAAVVAEAAGALAGKEQQLSVDGEPGSPTGAAGTGSGTGPQDDPAAPAGEGPLVEGDFTVTPAHGLHARPAARLVQALQGLDAAVELRNASTGSAWVPAGSLSRVATLGALKGQRIEARAGGPQARAALDRLLALAGRNFNDPPDDEPLARPATGEQASVPAPDHPKYPAHEVLSRGPIAASPGIAIGPARPAMAPAPDPAVLESRPEGPPAEEQHRLDAAIAIVHAQVARLRIGPSGDIFDAHLALLADPGLLTAARSAVASGESAIRAWSAATASAAVEFDALPDPYQRARAADVRAVGDQVVAELAGHHGGLDAGDGVLIAPDLTPAQAAGLSGERVDGVLLAGGSPSAHSVIILRSRGIPALVGAGPDVLAIADGTLIALDGATGELVIDPDEAVRQVFQARADAAGERAAQARAHAAEPAHTRDGTPILVAANLGSVDDARAAAAGGADLAGLVRTEFLFLDAEHAPTPAEQEAVYRSLAGAFGRRLTLRTLDVGGDKPLSYLPGPAEANPFLGVRGLRLGLRRPGLLADQLLAMVRTAQDHPVSIMFPMVTTLDELEAARVLLDDAIGRAGRGRPAGLQVGIMVEVPAAAIKAAAFAPHVDFFSLGTNDLTQYALAAERGNPALADLSDPLDPGVLGLIAATARGARAGRDVLVAVCGELAADPAVVPLLIGLGVRELSAAPRAVPALKEAVREVTLTDAEHLAGRALTASSAHAVRALLADPHA